MTERNFSTAVLFAEGATSEVFRAVDETSGKPVALKVLKSGDPQTARRFEFEVEALGRLDHPGIARLVDAGDWDGRPYLATEFIDGAPIDQALAGRTWPEIVKVFVKVVDALAHAHDQGLLHRDLKPVNVLVRQDGDGEPQPVIVDFGLSADLGEPSQTASGALLGTPAFMAPEQARGQRARVGRRTDIYGLGAVLYAVLAGRAPYDDASAGDIIAAILAGPPPRPGKAVPRKLEAVIDCAMARRPEQRYDSARRMAADLTAWLEGEPVRAMRGFRWRTARRTMARYRWLTAGLAVVAIASLVLIAQQVRLESRAAERQEVAVALNERLIASRERLRLAHLAPRHDITPTVDRIAQEVEALDEMATDERLRDNPTLQLVKGQLLMDAGHFEEAVQVLERARRLGCRSERCTVALARGYLQLYEQRLERQLLIAAKTVESDAPELGRARQLLDEVALSGSADLRLAALSRPIEEVARRAELLVSEQPWQYDALLALAETRYRAGLEAMRSDRTVDAMGLLAASEIDFGRAASIARSLPEAYLGACRARARRLELVTTGRLAADDGLERIPESCSVARTVLPGHVASYSLPALVLERLAVRAWRAGESLRASDLIGSAMETVERAPLRLTDQPALQIARARVLTTSVRVEHLNVPDGEQKLREALALARSASEARPESTSAWQVRAITLALLSERNVPDAAALVREAEETAARVAERWPGQRTVRNLLGVALMNLAYQQRLADGSGRAALERALEVLRNLVEDAPDYDSARNNLGMAYWELALQALMNEGDFLAAERRARTQFRKILNRNPDHPSARLNLSSLNLTLADALIEQGRSPGNRLDRSVELLGELRDAKQYFACDLALAYWLKARVASEAKEAADLRTRARAHADAGTGADCRRVQAESSAG